MSQIKQVLKLIQKGYKLKPLARELSISRNTIKSYLKKISENNWSIDTLLQLEDEQLERKFHSGNPAYKDGRYEQLKLKLDYYVKELSRVGVTKSLLYEEYKEEFPEGYGKTQFCHHLLQHIRAAKPSMVLNHKPGDKLYVDFAGKTISYTDQQTGEVVECQVFVACMPYSDYGFAIAVRSQSTEDFIFALTRCIEFLGGVPHLIVPDNLKAAVIKASRYEPELNRALEDFANHYNTAVLPARAAKPKDKALVENQVKLVYSRVFARLRNQTFLCLGHLNEAIGECMEKHNHTRLQEKPWSRIEKFLAEEKPELLPLANTSFELKYYATYKVAQNNHIRLSQDKKYYSVPYRFVGKKTKVVYTQSLVKIYYKGESIAVHPRLRDKREYYSTIKEHLASHHQNYQSRSPKYYTNRARALSLDMYKLFECIFNQDRHPEQLFKTCDGLLSLYRKLPKEKVDKACKIAVKHKSFSYKFICRLIENNMLDQFDEDSRYNPLPKHENVRGSEYYEKLFNNNQT